MQHRLTWRETTGTSAQDTQFKGENTVAELSDEELEPGETSPEVRESVAEKSVEKSVNRPIRKELVKIPDKTLSGDVAAVFSDSTEEEMSGPAKKPKTEFVKMSKTQFEFDITAILEKAGGQSIISELEEGGPQSASNRRRMVRIAVSHLIEKYGDKPSAEQKVGLARSIVEQFPILKDVEGPGYEAWYSQGIGGLHAKGYIEERLKNVRKRMPKQGWTSLEPSSKDNNQKEPSTKEKIEELKSEEKDHMDEDYEEMKQWLQHNNNPLDKVVDFMSRTALKRQEEIHSEKKSTVHDIELQWPRLFDIPNMIDGDFRAIHGDVSDRLIMKWTQELAKKILQYGEKQSARVHADIDDQSAQNAGVSALPLILPTGKMSTAKKSRATVEEAMVSFIDFQPIGTNLPQYLDALVGKRRQPFVLALGQQKAPAQCFAVVEGRAMKQESLLKAIDVCFKLFYVLDLEYPTACYTTWEFIQKVLYHIGARDKNTSSSVRSLRTYVLQDQDSTI